MLKEMPWRRRSKLATLTLTPHGCLFSTLNALRTIRLIVAKVMVLNPPSVPPSGNLAFPAPKSSSPPRFACPTYITLHYINLFSYGTTRELYE